MSRLDRVRPHAGVSSCLFAFTAIALAACGAHGATVATGAEAPASAAAEGRGRPGLGTSWGETVQSPIEHRSFERDSAEPWAELALHYNDNAGSLAHADYLGAPMRPLAMTSSDGGLEVKLVDDHDRTLPGFAAADRTLVLGQDGMRYKITVTNHGGERFEVVASVDGLDVLDGQPADPNRRGYLIDPHSTLVIDGYRQSDDTVAAFRFGRVDESYAAQTAGDRNVGVIGMAFFAERGERLPRATWYGPTWSRGEIERRDSANPFPQRGYASPPPGSD